ncbi:hypothetical protein WL99_19860 [Burkholderia cepacia]|uniref:hypothetical protein n=1 Tax=Burkholderia cepacia TaxID=292 RepID=UPI0007545E92|nr:hypothetical protein [Burkholderia cepacia]KWH27676.1 hypothetical protein WL99_19860 [Burkholderia cepacia]
MKSNTTTLYLTTSLTSGVRIPASSFDLALRARIDYAMAVCTVDHGSPQWHAYLKSARNTAYDLGYSLACADVSEEPSCSPLLADVPMLRAAFDDGVRWALIVESTGQVEQDARASLKESGVHQ